MDSIQFLKDKLSDLHNKFLYLEIRYEYRESIDAHIIEVKPIHCFEKDTPYKYEQINIQKAFKELFPYEEILFMTENILFQIEDPILTLGTSTMEVDYICNETLEEFIHITVDYLPVVPIDYMVCAVDDFSQVNEFESIYSEGGINALDVPITDQRRSMLPKLTEKLMKRLSKPQKKDSEIKNQSLFFY
jgi:hypothetical protein